MCKYRFVITGGDNGYCAKCGGLADRALLRIDDEAKTYKIYYFFNGCLGKWCWHEQRFCDGWMLVRGRKWQGEFTKMWAGNMFRMWRMDGDNVVEEVPVTVKGNKYGKDGEFGDKLDHYKFDGYIEPQEMIDEHWAKIRELNKNLYARMAERSENV